MGVMHVQHVRMKEQLYLETRYTGFGLSAIQIP